MVSQFVSPHNVNLLKNLNFTFPEGTHAVGRLDNDSEGLLILTTNKKLTRMLFSSRLAHERTYLVQVNNIVSNEKIQQLRNGVTLKIKGGELYRLPPCKVEAVSKLEMKWNLENRTSAYKPFTWLKITITEGKFRQVRKMIYAINHRCKRLIRISIENLELGKLQPGEVQEINEEEIFKRLKL